MINPYKTAPNFPRDPPDYAARERGGCLTLWLGVAILLNVMFGGCAFVQVITLYGSEPVVQAAISPLIIVIVGLMLVAVIAGLFGMWNWKKRGVYLVVGSFLVDMAVQLGPVEPVRGFIAPLVQLGILYFLVAPKWQYFE